MTWVGNRDDPDDDVHGVDCARTVEILSAAMDGEATDSEHQAAEAHLDECVDCRDRQRAMLAVTRAVRVTPAEPSPDVVASVLPAWRPRLLDRLRGHRGRPVRTVLRALLGAVALVQLVVAVRLLTGNGAHVHVDPVAGMPMPHVNHETGAWNAAVAVALGWVAVRARHARAHLPVLLSFGGVLAGISVFDLVLGNVTPARIATHVPVLVGLLLVAGLAVVRDEERRPGAPVAGEPGEPERAEVGDVGSPPVERRRPSPPAAQRRSA